MRDRSTLLPALVAVAATLVPALGIASPAAAEQVPSTTFRVSPAVARPAAAEGDEPLKVTITSLTPAYLPGKGTIRMRGSVTNVSDERWRAIQVYAFIDETPMTSSAELAATSEVPTDADVGERILIPGTFDPVGSLAPGETVSFTVQLRRNQVEVTEAGVYWFGAHALGNTDEARDTTADGRARTLLPLVPPDTAGRERASLVIPVRRAIRHTPDGRLRSSQRWAEDLASGGRLRALADFGAAAGDTPVTWLVDPAVPDAVARLVEGNKPRDLAEVLPVDGQEGEQPDPAEEESPSAEIVEGAEGEEADAEPNVAAGPGATWLTRLEDAMEGDQVLTLPYGDTDVAAAASSAPQFYDRAVRRDGTVLDQWRTRAEPAVAPPDGFVPQDSLDLLTGDETVILGDTALPEGEVRTSARVDGTRLLFASGATAAGGPGPGDPLSEIAMRQRFVAEAAVRLLFHDRTPLLTVFPPAFAPSSPTAFWSGLDEIEWLELTDTDELGQGRPLPAEELGYPVEQELTELDPENFIAAEQLIDSGRTLDNVLPRNDLVARQVLDEALTSVSYSERDRALESRRDSETATAWIQSRLERVRIRAPRGFTLSGDASKLAVTVTNRLDHPVRVLVRSVSLGDVEVATSDPLDLAAGARQTVLLPAQTSSPGVQYARVMVTDEDGTPLGAAQRVAIRSAAVSQVIWLILGVGVGLLFLAIAIRLVRRIRSERA